MILPSTLAYFQLDTLFEKTQQTSEPSASEPSYPEASNPSKRAQKRKPTATVKPMPETSPFSIEHLLIPEKKRKLENQLTHEDIVNSNVIMDLLREDDDANVQEVDVPAIEQVAESHTHDSHVSREEENKIHMDQKKDPERPSRLDMYTIPSTSRDSSTDDGSLSMERNEIYRIPDENSRYDVLTPDSDATVAAFDFSEELPVSPLVSAETNNTTNAQPTIPPLIIRIPMRSRANSRLRPSPPMLSDKISAQTAVTKRRSSEKENHHKAEKISPRKRANSTKKNQRPIKPVKIRKSVWSPAGQSVKKRVHLNNDSCPAFREVFPYVVHNCGVKLRENDNVTVNVGDDTGPSLAKIAHIFVDPDSGKLMASVVWYYREPQLELVRDPSVPMFHAHEREVLASRHIDTIQLDSVNEPVSVITYNEYCRYISENAQDASALAADHNPLWPRGEDGYKRRMLLPSEDTPPETVYFCRAMYDFKGHRVLHHGEARELTLKWK